MHRFLIVLLCTAGVYAANDGRGLEDQITTQIATAAGKSPDQATQIYESAIHQIDREATNRTGGKERLDALRESILKSELQLALSSNDTQSAAKLATRLRLEHPNRRGWLEAASQVAQLSGQGTDAAQASLGEEDQAAAAYDAAAQLRKHYRGHSVPPEGLQQIQAAIGTHFNGVCPSNLRCQWLLANTLLDSKHAKDGTLMLADLASKLAPAGGSLWSRKVRHQLFGTIRSILGGIDDLQDSLTICNAVLTAQEAGNEQDPELRNWEERIRAELLSNKAGWAARLHNDADVTDALDKLDAWFPTGTITLEAKKAVAEARGQDTSGIKAQLAAEKEANAALAPLLDDFVSSLRENDQRGTGQKTGLASMKAKWTAFMQAEAQYENTGTAINLLVDLGTRNQAWEAREVKQAMRTERLQTLSKANSLLGPRTGWLAFSCWDALSEAMLYAGTDYAQVLQLCDATLGSDPLLLRKGDAYEWH